MHTILQSEITLTLKFENFDLNESISPKKNDYNDFKNYFRPILSEAKEFSEDFKGELDLLKISQVNNNYIKRITPIVMINNYLTDIYDWKSTSHTFIFGILFTFFVKFYTFIIISSLIFIGINSKYIIKKILNFNQNNKNENLIKKNMRKLNRMKTNLTFLQVK